MKRKWPLYVTIVAAGIAVDLLTKSWAFRTYPPGTRGTVVIDGFFNFICRYNPKFAFSLGPTDKTLVAILHMAAFSAIGYLIYNLRRAPMHVHIALSFIIAGALGNLYDRMTEKEGVRDFIDWYIGSRHWPTFNVADTMVSVGASLIVITLLFTKGEKKTTKKKKAKASHGA